MKAIMLSIRPKWCGLIASGKKTVEVRKTKPKLKTPFKVYIYCTKDYSLGEFYTSQDDFAPSVQGKVIGEFVCDRITEYECSSDGFGELATTCGTCLTYDEIINYCNGNELYGWHISDLVIYDKPKELSEFYVTDNSAIQSCKNREITGQPEYKTAHNGWIKGSYICNANGEPDWCTKCKVKPITKPPQSWCYVEELKI